MGWVSLTSARVLLCDGPGTTRFLSHKSQVSLTARYRGTAIESRCTDMIRSRLEFAFETHKSGGEKKREKKTAQMRRYFSPENREPNTHDSHHKNRKPIEKETPIVIFYVQFVFRLLFVLEVLTLDKVGDVVVVRVVLLVVVTRLLLEALVALGELSERRQRVGAELVQDTRNELGQFLVLTVPVDGESVRGERSMDCAHVSTEAQS